MTTLEAYLPAISLFGITPFVTQDRTKRSSIQPPAWLFMVAWAIQAVTLGFVGQGIAKSDDSTLKTMWITWSSLLGPLQALSTWMQAANPELARIYDVVQTVGLLTFLIFIVQRIQATTPTEFNYLIWITVGWMSFAVVLTMTGFIESRPRVNLLRGPK